MANQKLHYQHLKEKWTGKQKKLQENLWTKHKEALSWISNNTKQLTAGGLMLLATSSSAIASSPSNSFTVNEQTFKPVDRNVFLISDLSNLLPPEVRPLTVEEEKKLSEILSRDFNVKVSAELDNKRLNRSYGLIGAEQHLARFPGDSMDIHFDSQEEDILYRPSGMAPGLGAWGYFARSEQEATQKDKLKEKYYIAVQTFLAPDFNNRFGEYRDFFKYRKMLVVNPNNGKAVVAVIGDAGPAEWTGKHLGGSPEVMKYLERVDGAARGPVLYFFIDDPEDKIPLGPIVLN